MTAFLRIMIFVAAAFAFWVVVTSSTRSDDATPGWCDIDDLGDDDALPKPVASAREETPSAPLEGKTDAPTPAGRELREHRRLVERPPVA